MSNDNIIQELVPIYGVGKWTVEMLLIFQLERLDVWPVDDFGVRKGYQIWKKLTEMPTPKELSVIGEKWAPYQTLVALMMWKVADAEKLKGKK
jgi:DNA-3-methyladenine glycosylase II